MEHLNPIFGIRLTLKLTKTEENRFCFPYTMLNFIIIKLSKGPPSPPVPANIYELFPHNPLGRESVGWGLEHKAVFGNVR